MWEDISHEIACSKLLGEELSEDYKELEMIYHFVNDLDWYKLIPNKVIETDNITYYFEISKFYSPILYLKMNNQKYKKIFNDYAGKDRFIYLEDFKSIHRFKDRFGENTFIISNADPYVVGGHTRWICDMFDISFLSIGFTKYLYKHDEDDYDGMYWGYYDIFFIRLNYIL
jgi:hypothetical protein